MPTKFKFQLLALGLLFVISPMSTVFGQQDKASRPSPAVSVTGKSGGANITINYSSPSVKGRKIFGDLVPYDKVWRTGANEATTFEVDKDVMVAGQKLAAGKYSFFAIPGETEWVVIFNKVASQWGAFKYDEAQDALRVKVPAGKSVTFNEKLTYNISPEGEVVLTWENTMVSFPVK